MRLIGLAVVLIASLLLAPLAAQGQQGKVRRVGVLSSGSAALDDVGNGRQAFLERLSDLGWVVGQNLTIESRHAERQLDRLPGLAAELVQLKVGMIVAFGTPAVLAAKRATTAIPIVIVAGDPVGTGLFASRQVARADDSANDPASGGPGDPIAPYSTHAASSSVRLSALLAARWPRCRQARSVLQSLERDTRAGL